MGEWSKFFRLVLFICVVSFATQANSSRPLSEGQLTIAAPFDLAPINPFYTSGTLSANIVEIIFDPLINLDRTYNMTPLLARTWDISVDQLTWVLHLEPSITFHDGKSLTAADVVFTYNVLIRQDIPLYAHALNNIKSISAIDTETVIFTLKKIDQSFPMLLRRVSIAPQHLFNEQGQPLSETYYQHPIGSGAFQATLVTPTKIVLQAYSNYFQGPPRLQQINFESLESEKQLLSKLIAGEIDIDVFFDVRYLDTTENIPHLTRTNYDNQHLFSLFFNLKKKPFMDKRVRQALNYGVNKTALYEKLVVGSGRVAASVVSPQNYFYNSKVTPYSFDPQKALTLLSQAGWTLDTKTQRLTQGGVAFQFTILIIEGSPFLEKIVNMIANDLSQLGIEVTVSTMPLPVAMKTIFSERNFDAALFPFSNLYPIDFDGLLWNENEKFNFTNYDNIDVTKFLMMAHEAKTRSESVLAYHDFQQAIHDDPPALYLFWRDLQLICNKRVQGMSSDPFRFFSEMRSVWIEE